ncbi:MAG: hypothetical protein Q4C79_08165 [Neisseria sp.]|uniref:hypothetical protein n=1 Tax=Neisseria sp. TaxID=192066 RepID=UPI0026DB86F8|nr:hypothetical protein [Neisseria sp.]MDO4248911.1 hypothetical protein [Neisseria sp.]
MKLKKTSSALFLSLMVFAGGAYAGGIVPIMGAATALGNAKTDLTVGVLTNTNIKADAQANGRDSEAMAGGVISATPKGEGLGAKVNVGVITGGSIDAKAKANNGGAAYAGGVISK